VADRCTQLLDTALALVGIEGVRGLTHEAVDAAAAVAPGTTSACFRTRAALIEGVADRCVQREQEMATGTRAEIEASPDGIAAAFGDFVQRAIGPDREVTLARYALQIETALTPSLRGTLAGGAGRVNTWAQDLIRRAGSAHPERDLGILANYVTGLVFHELALPTPELDAAARIRAVVDTLGWSTS
jgi:DNA-binding transcriptional regulator YbjK